VFCPWATVSTGKLQTFFFRGFHAENKLYYNNDNAEFFICSSGSTVVEHSHHHPNVKGSSPADDTNTRRERSAKNILLGKLLEIALCKIAFTHQ
jgi:hypothetical protein